MASKSRTALISGQASELQAVLHPLVLLSISDYITRHTLREHKWPIVGGLMGQHNGREVSIEHAFECHLTEAPEMPYKYRLDLPRVQARIEQLRTVHKDRSLDFVGWYTLHSHTGPTLELLQIHTEILNNINESAILLGFHPGEVLDHSVGGRLPLTIYESNYEVDDGLKTDNEGDDSMGEGETSLRLKFREIPYTVETGDAEMISIDFVARGSGNATVSEPPKPKPATASGQPQNEKGKQKAQGTAQGSNIASGANEATLSPGEDEMLAALTAKANATKMLLSRIQLMIKYLERLPPAFVSGQDPMATAGSDQEINPSNTILRQIQALVNRLDLIEPSDVEAFRKEITRERNDVQLISLLNDVVQSVHRVRDLGRKHDIIETTKSRDQRAKITWENPAGKANVGFSLPGAGDIIM